jgi:hypothetical protein
MKQRDGYEPGEKTHNPRPIILVCDATFYGKRKDKLGTLVFKDDITKEILLWKHIESEKAADYRQMLKHLLELGYTIQSVTVDGKRGLYKVFDGYPIQMCLFHQKRIIQRYITLNPKLQAGKDLRIIASKLTQTNQTNFTKRLDAWYEKYGNFINEKTINPETGKSFYTHQKVRAAYRSLRANLSHLFIYKNIKTLNIPTTTNTLEGGTFSPMKKKINTHSGMDKKLKLKMVDDYLLNHKLK